MKRIIAFTIIMMVLTACTEFQVQTLEPVAMDIPQVNMPNPASVYCEQNGNKLEIQTASDGSQSGICVFPDGSTCDEWVYFRGECDLATQNSPAPESTIEVTKDASSGGPGGGDNSGGNASGGFMEPGTSEKFIDWWGVIKSTDSGAQYDDYFERQDLGLEYINFGIDSMNADVKVQIEALCDTGKIVHLYGTLFSNVPDYNGSQVLIDRIEVEGN
jgi:putative hemolysin